MFLDPSHIHERTNTTEHTLTDEDLEISSKLKPTQMKYSTNYNVFIFKRNVTPKCSIKYCDSLSFSRKGYERAKNILKSKFGKTNEVIIAHVQGIMGLPVVNGTNPKFIRDFDSKLVTHVQALKTMGKLNMINGYFRIVSNRLPSIGSDIVRNGESWKELEFPQFIKALEKWTKRNAISNNEIKKGIGRNEKEKLNTKTNKKN